MVRMPASRRSSAVGSGLWWNEVKMTAWATSSAASRPTSVSVALQSSGSGSGAAQGGGAHGGGVGQGGGGDEDAIDAGEELGCPSPARSAEQRHAPGARGDGSD